MSSGNIKVNPDTPDEYSVELSEGEVLHIGRRPAPGGVKKLILPYPEVSGQHAEIRCSADGWTIMDRNSTNGTSVNGKGCKSGEEYPLRHGDQVQIAQYKLQIFPPQTDFDLDDLEEEDSQDRTQYSIKFMNATILVGDIKKFTGLMEKYASSPEVVMGAAQRIFDSLNDEINKNFGQLEKIAGDAIMAYWAGDSSSEGARLPAFQACHTALRLREVTTRLAQDRRFWPFEDYPLNLDIALATGPVASGSLGHSSGNPSVLGDTANLVFRLEKLIGDDRPGDIIVDGNTFSLSNDRCNFEYMGSYSIKGKSKAVEVYRLLSTRN
ncbi:MAG: adenylate/guanylate cyclase domain-containing protein [Candidatus Obscuribacterales bacterium]|nr:adenylate/guanylate cyclase domain-containing protein [Candidatus Obscuribacterales bacterium]